MLKFCVKKLQKPKKFLTFTAELKKYNRLSDSLKQHLINQPKSITFLIMKKFLLRLQGFFVELPVLRLMWSPSTAMRFPAIGDLLTKRSLIR